MEDKIIKILKLGRGIQPSEEFQRRSRGLILSSPQRRSVFAILAAEFKENLKFGAAVALATFLILVFLGGFRLPPQLTKNNTSLNGGDLIEEIENLDFQIQLGEARYFEESAMEIAAILSEIKKSDAEQESEL